MPPRLHPYGSGAPPHFFSQTAATIQANARSAGLSPVSFLYTCASRVFRAAKTTPRRLAAIPASFLPPANGNARQENTRHSHQPQRSISRSNIRPATTQTDRFVLDAILKTAWMRQSQTSGISSMVSPPEAPCKIKSAPLPLGRGRSILPFVYVASLERVAQYWPFIPACHNTIRRVLLSASATSRRSIRCQIETRPKDRTWLRDVPAAETARAISPISGP